ncbi:MarR family winged helix-turn-helix transcriptional regulator [Pararoseomonas indoligenes]|uniref:Winged helix-turn-helix transcriptional regulator n=1 Tax=Roseomonas indoligenes TaxID=2820811 RepID=A0A940S8Z0_9PROT|nr:MarR family winged helix-turn-helix transcriptional regulator [Pararoseomonas indoligenes]MBP0496405.1 winged helix-turn-helix transcriptional regulator [Pararoseomonas indoligenes]
MTVPLEKALTYRLHRLHKLTDRESEAAYLAELGIPLGEGRCLAAIGSFAPLSVQDLARCANLNKARASRAAQSLVEQGLVDKQASAADGRSVVLTLTPAGADLWAETMALIRELNDRFFGGLSNEERKVLGRLLDRAIEGAAARLGAADEP